MKENSPENAESVVFLADHERWYASIGYIFLLCFISLRKGRESDFIRFHARQAFLLFCAECIGFIVLVIVDITIGRLPFLGLLIVIVLQSIILLLALFLSVMGIVKSLFGERWLMPFLGQFSHRVPNL